MSENKLFSTGVSHIIYSLSYDFGDFITYNFREIQINKKEVLWNK